MMILENCWKVYKHTSPSGKIYVGITSKNVLVRWANGKAYCNNVHFYRAIQKYGWDNFTHEILFENLSKEEACQKEIELIAKYQSNNPEFGYNLSAGGEYSNYGHKQSKEFCEMMSKLHSGKIVSLETRNRLSEVNSGKKLSEETKRKISVANKGHIVS